jgi:hypothetical protein
VELHVILSLNTSAAIPPAVSLTAMTAPGQRYIDPARRVHRPEVFDVFQALEALGLTNACAYITEMYDRQATMIDDATQQALQRLTQLQQLKAAQQP